MHVGIFAGGDFVSNSFVKKKVTDLDCLIAADGGAEHILALGLLPNYVVGDMDSLSKKSQKLLKKRDVQCIEFQTEKDETDTELALQLAVEKGATEITIFGGIMGNRIDHVMANILLATLSPVPLRFIHANQVAWIEKGTATCSISGKKGDLLSLIPLQGNVAGLVSRNLKYSLKNEELIFGKPRGVSNMLLADTAELSFISGTLLLVQTQV